MQRPQSIPQSCWACTTTDFPQTGCCKTLQQSSSPGCTGYWKRQPASPNKPAKSHIRLLHSLTESENTVQPEGNLSQRCRDRYLGRCYRCSCSTHRWSC